MQRLEFLCVTPLLALQEPTPLQMMLREKLHERIEARPMLMAVVQGIIEVLLGSSQKTCDLHPSG